MKEIVASTCWGCSRRSCVCAMRNSDGQCIVDLAYERLFPRDGGVGLLDNADGAVHSLPPPPPNSGRVGLGAEALARCLGFEAAAPLSIRLREFLVEVSTDLRGGVVSQTPCVQGGVRPRPRLEAARTDGTLVQHAPKQTARALRMYCVATCAALRLPWSLSISVGQARVGHKGCVCGLLALPPNTGAVFAPQVVASAERVVL